MKKKPVIIFVALVALIGLTIYYATNKPADSKLSGSSNYPSKAITILCPWSAGGGSDLAIRTLVPYLEEELGASITVVNQTGANGWIAWTELYNAEPDGYTIAQMNIPTFAQGYLDRKNDRKHISLADFTPLCNEISDWGCLVVRADEKRFSTAEEFVAYARNNPMVAGDSGQGSQKHMLTEKLNSSIGTKLTPLHQAGWSVTYAAILGGHIDIGWGSVGECLQGYKDGEVKVLAVFAPKRASVIPDVPTFEECGFPGIYSPSDRGYVAPAGLDEDVLAKLDAAFKASINNPQFIEKMEGLGQAVNYMDRESFTQYCRESEDHLKKLAGVMGWDIAD